MDTLGLKLPYCCYDLINEASHLELLYNLSFFLLFIEILINLENGG